MLRICSFVRPPAIVADAMSVFSVGDEEAMTAVALISGWGMLARRRVIPFRVIDREPIAPGRSGYKKRSLTHTRTTANECISTSEVISRTKKARKERGRNYT